MGGKYSKLIDLKDGQSTNNSKRSRIVKHYNESTDVKTNKHKNDLVNELTISEAEGKRKCIEISTAKDGIFKRFFTAIHKGNADLSAKSFKSNSNSTSHKKFKYELTEVKRVIAELKEKISPNQETVPVDINNFDLKDIKDNGVLSELSIDSLYQCSNTASQIPSALIRLGYELHQQIGFGGFSTVYIASNRFLPGVQFACKMFKLNEINKCWIEKCLKNEMRIMMKLRHPNIIAAYDAIKTRSKAYIFMKFAKNGSIDTYLCKYGGKIGESQCRKWFTGLMSAVSYLHHHNIAHRDLKLDNFLLNENLEPLVSDFSFAVIEDKNPILRKTICGTPLYMAPEIHLIANDKCYDAKKSDIYSMGICFYEMLHGYKPYEGVYDAKSKELAALQMNCNYKIDPILNLSHSCKDLIKIMLDPKPEKRPKAKVILKNVWFKSCHNQAPKKTCGEIK